MMYFNATPLLSFEGEVLEMCFCLINPLRYCTLLFQRFTKHKVRCM